MATDSTKSIRQPPSIDRKTSIAVLLAAVFTMLLYVVPLLRPIAYPFLLLSTLVHEMGHGLAAILVGGHFESFFMWADGSGAANIRGDFGHFSRAFVAAAGLVGPSIMAALFFLSLKSERKARVALASFGIVLLLAILLVVRNLFGVAFVAGISALCLFFSLGGAKAHARTLAAFLATQLALSVFSRSDYLFTDVAQTSAGTMPSDVAQMAEALWLPYWVFGALCGIFSIAILTFGIKRLIR